MTNQPPIRVIIGPTASGKAKLATSFAEDHGLEIISMDSMKVYRHMDIGTAKPTEQMRRRVKFHLIDIVEPTESFSVADWASLAERISDEMLDRGASPLFVGGTALYYKALTEGIFKGPGSDPGIRKRLREEAAEIGVAALHERLKAVDPLSASRILPGDLRRIERALEVFALTGRPISSFQRQFGTKRTDRRFILLGLLPDRQLCYELCDKRVDRMLEAGLLREARALFERYPVLGPTASQAVGYKEFYRYFRGETDLNEAVEMVKKNTRHFARRQYMWFRKFNEVTWVPVAYGDTADSLLDRCRKALPEFFEF
ncbi:MAG: tRNA (adenosine(37)-N6)-dimethylallyltransferase MiaA [Planctomycetota bacterium]